MKRREFITGVAGLGAAAVLGLTSSERAEEARQIPAIFRFTAA